MHANGDKNIQRHLYELHSTVESTQLTDLVDHTKAAKKAIWQVPLSRPDETTLVSISVSMNMLSVKLAPMPTQGSLPTYVLHLCICTLDKTVINGFQLPFWNGPGRKRLDFGGDLISFVRILQQWQIGCKLREYIN